jgi:ADP-heptose:LPS heptosyltransferase
MGLGGTLKSGLTTVAVRTLRALGWPWRKAADGPRRFLVVSTTGVGDTLWGTPAIRALKETYPDSFVGVLTSPIGAEVLTGNPHIDRIHVIKRGGRGGRRVLRELRAGRYGTACVFHISDRLVWLLVFLCGAREIIGNRPGAKGMHAVLTTLVAIDENAHLITRRMAVVAGAGAHSMDERVAIYPDERDRSVAEAVLQFIPARGDGPLVGLHPGAKDAYKCWPKARFMALGQVLVQRHGARVVVTGDKTEAALALEVARGIPGALPMAGKTSLREAAALIGMLDAFVTNDTGPMHLGFAMGAPTVGLFCPTRHEACGPHHAVGARVISKPVTCEPCVTRACTDNKCMDQITVEEVAGAVGEILARKATHDHG